MKLSSFRLERFFAQHEFSARYLLSSSDCEALSQRQLLALADDETRRLWEELRLGYTDPRGHPLLRSALADGYRGMSSDELLVLAPEEGIFLFMNALLEPGDHVVCAFPTYPSLYEVARAIGCDVSWWSPDEEHGWRFDLERLEQLLRPNTKLVVVNFPHNPTGAMLSRADFTTLVELVVRRGAMLFSDEMYRFLELDPAATLPAACELSHGAAVLGGLSKSFGLPGLRMGWVASHDRRLLERMAELKDYTTICSSAPSEILALCAFRNRAEICRRQCERIRRNVAVFASFVQAHSEWLAWNRPEGGSVCLARLRGEHGASAFCRDLLAETGIMLVSSELFAFGDRHVRFGLGRENFPEVLALFGAHLEARHDRVGRA